MQRSEILAQVNGRSLARYKIKITDNMLGDMLESRIVAAPEKHGRTRHWSRNEYRQLLEITRLKSFGISDHAEIQWMLWVKGRNVVPMNFNDADRIILANLFDQRIARLFRGINSEYPEVKKSSPDEYPARSVLSKMGELDESLTCVVEYERRELLGFYEMLRYGNPVPNDVVFPAVKRIGTWVGNSLRFPIRVPFGIVSKLFRPHVAKFVSGMARQPDGRHSAVARSVMNATPEQFEHARQLLGLLDRLFRRMGLKRVAVSLLHPSWRLPMLAFTVHYVRLMYRQKRSWLPSMAEIDLADRILSK